MQKVYDKKTFKKQHAEIKDKSIQKKRKEKEGKMQKEKRGGET